MTREEILAEPAGRRLDAWVAEKVMAWIEISPQTWCGYPPESKDQAIPYKWPARMGALVVPHYSTDISAAWLVVEKLREQFTNFSLRASNGWGAWCWDVDREGKERNTVVGVGHTPMDAICRASLLAVLEPSRETYTPTIPHERTRHG